MHAGEIDNNHRYWVPLKCIDLRNKYPLKYRTILSGIRFSSRLYVLPLGITLVFKAKTNDN